MMRRSLFLALALTLAACATVPPPAPDMDAASFDQIMMSAEANPSPASVDLALSDLLARPDLGTEQRASALFLRAEKRRMGRFNLPGAIEDYDAFMALAPGDARVAEVEQGKSAAAAEVDAAARRLAVLQNQQRWFDDKVLMGALPEAAQRYRNSGLLPTELQLYTLREAGYVCEGGSEPVFRYGEVPSYGLGASWCVEQGVS